MGKGQLLTANLQKLIADAQIGNAQLRQVTRQDHQAQFVGENWAGFIVAACIAVCALAQTLMAPPTESSSAIYKIIYAVTAKFGGNFGKARNAVPGNTG